MKLTQYFSPFYDHGRRFVGIKPSKADDLIARGARATVEPGIVTITVEGESEVYATNKHIHRKDIVKWVNEFNKRWAGELKGV